MAVAVSPIEQLRREIEITAQRPDLQDDERSVKLRNLEDSLNHLLGLAQQYRLDNERSREAAALTQEDAVFLAYANATLREDLLVEGLFSEEELDEAGLVSVEVLDAHAEEGTLLEAVESYVERLHPRDRAGRWQDKPNLARLLNRVAQGGADLIGGERARAAQERASQAVAAAKKKRTGKKFQKKVGAVEKRVSRTIKRGNLSTAEQHFNEAGKVSQRTLLQYVSQAASKPTTASLYGERQPDGSYVWDQSRQALHEQIIDKFLRQRVYDPNTESWGLSAEAPELKPSNEPRVLFSGGGYAAGKSSVLKINRARGGEPESGYDGPALVLDPDQVKAELPEFQQLLEKDPEANLHVYEEAWAIAQEIQARAQERKLNMVVDGISDTSPDEMLERARSFTDRGYKAHAIYVDIPTNEALRRAAERARKAAQPSDRRHIPEVIMRSVHRDVSATVPNLVRRLQSEGIDMNVEVWDNDQGKDENGNFRPPKRFYSYEGGKESIEDPALWERFVNKAYEAIRGVDPEPAQIVKSGGKWRLIVNGKLSKESYDSYQAASQAGQP